MVTDSQRAALEQVVEPILLEASAELVEMQLPQHRNQLTIRLLVDKVGGITIQECARLNQRLGQALDHSGLLSDRYILEVSSPGLDRPIVSKRDYERAIGEELDLELLEPVRGSRRLIAPLLAVQEEAVVMSTSTGNVVIPVRQIQRARKAIHL